MKLFVIDRCYPFAFLCLLVALVVGRVELSVATGDESAPADAKDTTQPAGDEADDAAKKSDEKSDEKKEADVLLDKIHALNRKQPEGATRDEKINSYRKIQWEIVDVAEKLYGLSHDEEKEGLTYAAVSVQVTVRSLRTLQQLGDDKAKDALGKFVELIAEDKRPQVSQFGARLAMELKYEFSFDVSEDEVNEIAALLKEDFSEGAIQPQNAGLIMQVLSRIEQSGHTNAALDLNRFFSQRFAASENKKLVEVSERLAGAARRLDLPGKPIKVAGVFMDGSEIDWKSYRGKVVLLDYWATWCGPCIAELPNLLEHYEIYHDRGFEVVGISVDEDREAVEKFLKERELPWKTIYGDKPENTGWNHPMALYYGIGGIPTVILVDKEGNVVSLNARGKELARLLAELIGPPEEGQKGDPLDAGAEKKAGAKTG